jgi:hypothetical protein
VRLMSRALAGRIFQKSMAQLLQPRRVISFHFAVLVAPPVTRCLGDFQVLTTSTIGVPHPAVDPLPEACERSAPENDAYVSCCPPRPPVQSWTGKENGSASGGQVTGAPAVSQLLDEVGDNGLQSVVIRDQAQLGRSFYAGPTL